MFKHILAVIILSLLIVLFPTYFNVVLNAFITGHDWFAQILAKVFSTQGAGDVIRSLLAMLALPLLVALIPAFVYWLARKKMMPYVIELFWVIWLVEITALLMQ